jgi:hypothetical protein
MSNDNDRNHSLNNHWAMDGEGQSCMYDGLTIESSRMEYMRYMCGKLRPVG